MLTIELNKTKVTRKWLTTTRQYHYPHDKPAYTRWHPNGNKYYEAYRLNNRLHREGDMPAGMTWYSNGKKWAETYYINDQYHRADDKPAATYWDRNGQNDYELYHLNGTQYIPRKTTC